jgi:ABC-2 type transport system permease protein
MDNKSIKKDQLGQFGLVLAISVLAMVLSSYLFFRIDLTQDKRYTLSVHTKTMLKQLDDIVYFRVYLDGDLPPGFVRLQNAIREHLDDFRAYGGDNIQYEFINPSENPDTKLRNQFFRELYQKGLNPTNLQVNETDGGASQKIVWPGIVVSYRGTELAVNVLKNYVGQSAEDNLNSSVQGLEYELMFALNRLTSQRPTRIGFTQGHGELPDIEVNDLAQSLAQFYTLERVALNENLYSLKDTFHQNRYDVLIVAKPTLRFSEKDKFILDQHLMSGGKILWALDAVTIDMDSLSRQRSTLGLINDINLDDMLFKYGIRLNPVLLQDMQCAVIPVNTAMVGQTPQWTPAPWLYFPLLSPQPGHPLTKNLDMVKSQFTGSIDTVGLDPRITKHILLNSSKYTRKVTAPVMVDLSIISQPIDERYFNQPFQAVAVLAEGQFESVYNNRLAPVLTNNPDFKFIAQSNPTAIIVLADGDLLRNHVSGTGNNAQPLPLGYDRFTKQTFGNKEFILNCINYLTGNKAMLEARAKEYKLRLLDKPRLKSEKQQWQFINVVLPLVIVALCGWANYGLRRRKYAKTHLN